MRACVRVLASIDASFRPVVHESHFNALTTWFCLCFAMQYHLMKMYEFKPIPLDLDPKTKGKKLPPGVTEQVCALLLPLST